tara:strand:+ start:7207 stop:8502 length:1296 start_codon:yes stop_codon:yes gene_type:complete
VGISEKEILEKLKKQAEEYTLPVKDFVWAAIKKEVLPIKEKKRFGFWWLGATGLLIGLSLITIGYDFNDNAIVELKGKENHVTHSPFNNENNFVIGGRATKIGLKSLDTNQNFIDPTSVKRTRSDKSLTDSPISATPKPDLRNTGIQDNQREELSHNVAVDLSKHQTGAEDNSLEETQQKREVRKVETAEITEIEIDLVNPDSDSFNADPVKNEIIVSEQPIQKEKKGSLFGILLKGGIGESFRVLKSGTHHDLITHKNDHEKFGECFEIGLDFQFKLGNRFVGRSGIGYKFYSDKYDFQHDLITHTTRNDYQYFQVPLILGFNILPRPKSNLYILGGIKANILTAAQSSWVDVNALAPVAHNNASTNTPFRSLTTALNLGLDYNYRLSDKFNLHIIPSVDAFLNSVYKRKTDLNQRPYSFNIDLGISYNF